MDSWSRYYFTDNPFKEAPYIMVELDDDRLNGAIFSKMGFEKSFNKLFDLVARRRPLLYVTSEADLPRGSGKSALMAAAYWRISKDDKLGKEYLPVWVSVQDFRTITQLMGRVVETLVFAGVIDSIKSKLVTVDYSNVDVLLGKKKRQRLAGEVGALTKILELPNQELAWKYVNIRRTYPTIGHVELFTDFLLMFSENDKRRLLVFVDQFEEYVEFQYGQRLVQLGNDLKDLYRAMGASGNLSFIVTMHPKTQQKFESKAQEIITSYGEISDNSATVDALTPAQLIQMAKLYMSRFRTKEFPSKLGEAYPLDDEILEYVAKNSKNVPRIMIRILSNLMYEALLQNLDKVTMKILLDPTTHDRVGLGAIPTE
jgi:hypothetical protein